MPIYEFECPIHGRFERILSLQYCGLSNRGSVCMLQEGCFEHCEKVWALPGNKNLQCGKPTVVFRNPRTGECEVATSDNQQAPNGYIRQELRGPLERTKFEKEMSLRKYVEDELTTEKLKRGREETAKNIHDDIKARMNSNTNKVYNPETKQEENVSWDAQTKDLLKRSMNHTRKKHARIKPKRTNVMLAVNHIDNSNLVK